MEAKHLRVYKRIYWIANGLLSISLLSAGILYLISPVMAEGFRHFGFPPFFRIELGVGKIIGSILLLLPSVAWRIKEWIYVSIAIVLLSAFIAHTSVDGISSTMSPLISTGLWLISVVYFEKLKRAGVGNTASMENIKKN